MKDFKILKKLAKGKVKNKLERCQNQIDLQGKIIFCSPSFQN